MSMKNLALFLSLVGPVFGIDAYIAVAPPALGHHRPMGRGAGRATRVSSATSSATVLHAETVASDLTPLSGGAEAPKSAGIPLR